MCELKLAWRILLTKDNKSRLYRARLQVSQHLLEVSNVAVLSRYMGMTRAGSDV